MALLTTSYPSSELPKALYTYPELVFCAVGLLILAALTIMGNSLVLVAVARTKKLQNITNVFVVNLSVADCLAGFAVLWSVPGLVSKTSDYPLQSNDPCMAAAGLVFIAKGCSVFTLANIALNRYILITRPKAIYHWLYTPKKVALFVLSSWLVPVCYIILPPACGIGGLGFNPDTRTCADVETHLRAEDYEKIQIAFFYPVPLFMIIVSYGLIWRHVRRHFKVRRQPDICLQSAAVNPSVTIDPSFASRLDSNGDHELSASSSPAVSSRRTKSSCQHSRTVNDQLKITKNLLVVVIAFVGCFTPITITAITNSHRVHLYSTLVLFLHGCISPVIYAAKHPHFRPVLRFMIRCRCPNNKSVFP
ncbi:D(4) dopamine receptor-like [Acanthaster planci]|uniref:D(4) dopamine receptor-like n=1 Tax=Acanthaster planci TaxID=133434 RepID=A0A8B7XMZ5_ACAPL|nr:D(4) dopamine receptor-like [Acanthaster planci]